MRFGGCSLFGMMTSAERASGPVVILVGGRVDHHIGPARLWVTLAREWATMGVRVFRMDLSGIGDSGVRDGQNPQVPFAREAVDDILVAAETISAGDPSSVVLAGFCAGAYAVIEAGIRLVPRAVVVLNPTVTFEPPELAESGGVDRTRIAIQKRPAWMRRLRRGGLVTWARYHTPQFAWQLLDRLGIVSSPAKGFAILVDRGVQTLVACGAADSEIYTRMAGRQLKRLVATGLFRFEIVDGLSHALLSLADREACRRLYTEQVRLATGISSPSTVGNE
jgi:hypothetical protein